MDSTDALLRYNWGERERAPSCGLDGRAVTIDIYIYRYIYRRPYVHRYCACAALRANVAGRIWNRFSPAESAFSACIGIESDQLSQYYDDHLGLQTTGRRAFPAAESAL